MIMIIKNVTIQNPKDHLYAFDIDKELENLNTI